MKDESDRIEAEALTLTDVERAFIREHAGDDPVGLLLQAGRYPTIRMAVVVEQLAARRVIREKLPTWWEHPSIIYPSRLAAEQCSSEQTGRYKQELIEATDRVVDLTGGMGVDSYFLAGKAREVTYVERQTAYAEVARHNFNALGVDIQIRNTEAEAYVASSPAVDVFYLDPDRRVDGNKRLYALEDCSPNLITLLPLLLEKGDRVLVKLSPMEDITLLLDLLPQTVEVHVLSVKNEVKELLFLLSREGRGGELPITCVNFAGKNIESRFVFTREGEQEAVAELAKAVGEYLYEPHASILKAGAYKSVGVRFGLQKLHLNSHLYTTDSAVEFPGRRFRVLAVHTSGGKLYKQLGKWYPKANLTVRNFPMSVAELRQRTRIREGGELYLFATTLRDNQRVIIACEKV